MSDVLVVSIALDDNRYASVNAIGKDGFRGGRKSEPYKAIFKAIKEAAEAEIKRIGWTSTACEHDVTVYRFLPLRLRADASNMGKAELDALTKAGAWPDDRYGNPARYVLRYDAAGPHRISVVIVKLYEPANRYEPLPEENAQELTRRSRRDTNDPQKVKSIEKSPKKPRGLGGAERMKSAIDNYRSGDPIPPGYADVSGKLVPHAEALAMIQGQKRGSRA